MSNSKLFVSNISWAVTEEQLYDLFLSVGAVTSFSMPLDRNTGKPRGFAFVEMASPQLAERAIQLLSERNLHGRNILVVADNKNGSGGSQGGASVAAEANPKLFITNLDWSVSPAELEGLFAGIGPVVSVRIPTDPESGQQRNFGFVEMASAELAQQAIAQLSGVPLKGRELLVVPQDPNRSGKKRDSRSSYGERGGDRYGNSNRGNDWDSPRQRSERW